MEKDVQQWDEIKGYKFPLEKPSSLYPNFQLSSEILSASTFFPTAWEDSSLYPETHAITRVKHMAILGPPPLTCSGLY